MIHSVVAVTLRDPLLAFDSSGVKATYDAQLASRYVYNAKGLRVSSAGRRQYAVLKKNDIAEQAKSANITLSDHALNEFIRISNHCHEMFDRIFIDFTGLKDKPLRIFPLCTYWGAGRSCTLHVDNTFLTLHWSAGLTGLAIANNDPDENTWNAMDRRKNPDGEGANFSFLRAAAQNRALDIRDNSVGDIIITKGQKDRDLSDPLVRPERIRSYFIVCHARKWSARFGHDSRITLSRIFQQHFSDRA